MTARPDITFEIVEANGSQSLYLDGHRLAGPKPWGGGTIVRSWKVPTNELHSALPWLRATGAA